MSKSMIILIAIIVIVAIIVLWAISTTNEFKRSEIRVKESASGIEAALTKRFDTLTKMLDVAKGYTDYEQETILKTISVRKGMSIDEMNSAYKKMNKVLSEINITAEEYPELRSSEVFMELQRSILDVEEKLQSSRKRYNSNVKSYNTVISMFPARLFAGNRTEKDFFISEEQQMKDIKIEL